MRWAALTAVVVAAGLGCASASSAPREADVTATTSLSITYWPTGRDDSLPRRWTLRCGPSGGTHPRPAAACTRLAGLKAPFAPVPRDAICTAVYGGPDQALISGRFRGRRTWTKFALNDGCQIARFKQIAFLIPEFSGRGSP